jgi:uncharacterized metal-binding protein YceD (DUF177 family)
MGNPLRDARSPSDLAACGQVIEIEENISSFERLAGIVEADLQALDPDKLPARWRNTSVTGRLSFGFQGAEGSVPALVGHAKVTVDAVCQRCLEPFVLPLSAELRWVFAVGQPVDVDADDFELWELDADVLRPLDVVDEALVMSFPLAAKHEGHESCSNTGTAAAAPVETITPFASLRAQMEDKS